MKKFYCQGCGEEVPLNSNSCPNCYKEFGAVLCPKCNYRGSSKDFFNGCPKCGYLKAEVIKNPDNRVEKKTFNLSFKMFIILLTGLLAVILYLIYLFFN